MATNQSQSLLTETDVSKRLNISLAALRRWRLERRGPQYIKCGALVRYRPEEVDHWLATRPAFGGEETTRGERGSNHE